ncbi:hypothetical protein RHS04_00736 [Rhizoctonia solani]|uniref:Uncharacterized protein n=1 Tax=Rhizoctonia solani TaxID=456999 RepID=A0A8H7HG65_9AGAM|nr:hypothetical protein RHS04_00736 [Rhizoctonia solani]
MVSDRHGCSIDPLATAVNESKTIMLPAALVDLYQSVHMIFPPVKKSGSLGTAGQTVRKDRSPGKRSPSPRNSYKPHCSRTPPEQPMAQVGTNVTMQRLTRPDGASSLLPGPVSAPCPDLFPVHHTPQGSFITSGFSYTYDTPSSVGILPYNGFPMMDHTWNSPTLATTFHGQYSQQPMSMTGSSSVTDAYASPTVVRFYDPSNQTES